MNGFIKTISNLIITFLMSLLFPFICHSEEYLLHSPDKTILLTVLISDTIQFSVQKNKPVILLPSSISMEIEEKHHIGKFPQIESVNRRTVDQIVKPIIKEKMNEIHDHYTELHFRFKQKYALTFRSYNNGVAYRWETYFPDSIIITGEEVEFQLSEGDSVYLTKENGFQAAYEKPYIHRKITDLSDEDFGGLSTLVHTKSGIKLLLAESDLVDYPGLWLRGGNNTALTGIFPRYPKDLKEDGRILSRENYSTKTNGTRTFPWRVIGIAVEDKELLTNQLIYQLATPLQIKDPSWIKPGQVILDWWGRRNIFGIDFKAGVNTETMKYFIDFCAEYNIDYFLLDEGWSTRNDVLRINPDVDMEEVIAYSKEKGVGLILWLYWKGLDDNLENALDQMEEWSIQGIKVDFMNRDDQLMVNFYHKVAREAAKRKMVIDFHGSYKPAGLRRAYPNVLTREGFIEFEYNGWTDLANPEYHLTFPFIRMVCGPVDYIPGTLNNAQKKNFRMVGDRPMGQGTRAHSFALAVVLESPLRMLPDSPSDYYLEDECTRFLTQIPVEWDETIILEAKLSDYITLARRHGDIWYVAAVCDWSGRETNINLSFLDDGNYRCEIIRDGPNSHNRARDYQTVNMSVSNQDLLPIKLAPGGGWIARISKMK